MRKWFAILILIIVVVACKKQIALKPIVMPNSYLVVDGHINSGDSTFITLSRTVNITGAARANPELNATIAIEGQSGGSFPLIAKGNGSYASAILNLSPNQNYRLKIVTRDGRQYASDFVPLKNSPPIDTVSYAIKGDGLQINVDTHDATNSTHYYKWDNVITYQVRSKYESKLIVVNNDTTAVRPADQQIYNCWVNDTSGNITLGSSAKLSRDVISKQAVALILPNSEKLQIGLSILVKQYALTTDAFNYYDLLKRNSEQIGGVFDAQPSELTGNIHCLTNAAEPVIGFITVGTVTKKRLFVDNKDLPSTWLPDLSYYNGCYIINEEYNHMIPGSSYIEHQVKEYIYTRIETPIDTFSSPVPGIYAAKHYCADCTLRGTNKKPSFWK